MNAPESPPGRRVAPRFLQAKPRSLDDVAEYVGESPLPPAVVCEVGWVNGLGAIRSLGRAGIRTIALDHRPWALGFRSRYALPLAGVLPVAAGALLWRMWRLWAPLGAAALAVLLLANAAGYALARPTDVFQSEYWTKLDRKSTRLNSSH